MRAAKSVLLGRQLAALYLRASRAPAEEHLAALQRIERRIDGVTPPQDSAGDPA